MKLPKPNTKPWWRIGKNEHIGWYFIYGVGLSTKGSGFTLTKKGAMTTAKKRLMKAYQKEKFLLSCQESGSL